MTDHGPSLAREFDAALAWWRSAGVDCDFTDDARAWLVEPAALIAEAPAPIHPVQAPAAAPPHAPRDIAARSAPDLATPPKKDFWDDSPPQSLAEFQRWWLESERLAPASSARRVAPRGAAGARLMVVAPDPEAGDTDRLLSGPQGRLLGNILKAMGIAREDCYFASALPAHTPMADLAGLAGQGWGSVLACHIALAKPQRALFFGQGLDGWIEPLAKDKNHGLREINYAGVTTPVMVTETLASMLDMPRLKARFWRRWIEWSATQSGAKS